MYVLQVKGIERDKMEKFRVAFEQFLVEGDRFIYNEKEQRMEVRCTLWTVYADVRNAVLDHRWVVRMRGGECNWDVIEDDKV